METLYFTIILVVAGFISIINCNSDYLFHPMFTSDKNYVASIDSKCAKECNVKLKPGEKGNSYYNN